MKNLKVENNENTKLGLQVTLYYHVKKYKFCFTYIEYQENIIQP